MKVKLYEQLCVMNQGFDQVRRSLKELAKHSFLEPSEIRPFPTIDGGGSRRYELLFTGGARNRRDRQGGTFVRAAQGARAPGRAKIEGKTTKEGPLYRWKASSREPAGRGRRSGAAAVGRAGSRQGFRARNVPAPYNRS